MREIRATAIGLAASYLLAFYFVHGNFTDGLSLYWDLAVPGLGVFISLLLYPSIKQQSVTEKVDDLVGFARAIDAIVIPILAFISLSIAGLYSGRFLYYKILLWSTWRINPQISDFLWRHHISSSIIIIPSILFGSYLASTSHKGKIFSWLKGAVVALSIVSTSAAMVQIDRVLKQVQDNIASGVRIVFWDARYEAVLTGDIDAVGVLTLTDKNLDLQHPTTGTTLSMVAAQNGQEEILIFLLDMGADPDLEDILGNTVDDYVDLNFTTDTSRIQAALNRARMRSPE